MAERVGLGDVNTKYGKEVHVLNTLGTLASVKPGDIVTIKPDSSNSAKTITVVK